MDVEINPKITIVNESSGWAQFSVIRCQDSLPCSFGNGSEALTLYLGISSKTVTFVPDSLPWNWGKDGQFDTTGSRDIFPFGEVVFFPASVTSVTIEVRIRDDNVREGWGFGAGHEEEMISFGTTIQGFMPTPLSALQASMVIQDFDDGELSKLLKKSLHYFFLKHY